MWREGRHKLNVYHDPSAGGAGVTEGELYDLEEDPLEMNNLWSDPVHTSTREPLTERLLNWLAQRNDPAVMRTWTG
jgi:hypothetical protein